MTISNSFLPNRQTIQAITKANPGVVTTTQAHGYHDGLFVRLVLPGDFGMQQVDNQVYQITVLSPTTFSLNSDTQFFDAFSNPGSLQTPQVIPMAEVASTLANAVVNGGDIIPEN